MSPRFDPHSLAETHVRIADWYASHGRHHLPWRLTEDPFRIHVSEVMLQQTQVATVLARFYHPFLERFPTLEALASAPEEEVMKAWEGLGYYSRARNLQKAAQMAGPALPRDVEGLLALPGIGRNTAHAIAAFAYRAPVAILEANVKRIVYRVIAAEKASDAELWGAAQGLLGDADPFVHNQAMMDIGQAICTPRNPDCPACPLNLLCLGQANPERYPARKAKRAVPVRMRTIAALRTADDRYYLAPRTSRFLGGLYAFPDFASDEPPRWEGRTLINGRLLGAITQTYSHFRLEAEVMLYTVEGRGEHWHARGKIDGLALSGADRKVLALLPQEGQLEATAAEASASRRAKATRSQI